MADDSPALEQHNRDARAGAVNRTPLVHMTAQTLGSNLDGDDTHFVFSLTFS